MIPAWLVIGGVAVLLAGGFNFLFPSNYQWFMRLHRPRWLTFEWAIPLIWSAIFVCGIGSAAVVWAVQPGSWGLMAGYGGLELLILAYMPVMCGFKSLLAGSVLGATGWLWGGLLALGVGSVSPEAVYWLVPYLLWSPVGTVVTWEMIKLNPPQG